MNKVKRALLKYAIPYGDSNACTTIRPSPSGSVEVDPTTRTVMVRSPRGLYVVPLDNFIYVELELPAPVVAPQKK